MNSAAKGRRQEHRSAALLEAAGYDVTRAAASKGVWDLIGISGAGLVLVQVKSSEWPRAAEMETLRDYPAPACAQKLVHRWRPRARRPDVREL